jgi:SpoVK/Ycf46/Vps4 family AAA+-type ATPase
MTHEFMSNLRLTLASPYPYTYLLSFEEARVDRMVRLVAEEMGRPVVTWSSTRGIQLSPGMGHSSPDAATRDPGKALDHAAMAPTGSIYLFLDLHPFLREPGLLRRMRDYAEPFSLEHKAVVLVSPVLQIPREIEKEVTILDVPLPDETELRAILDALLRSENLSLDAALCERAVLAARGLTEHEAQRVFIKALLAGARRTLDVGTVLEEKRQILRKSEVLDYFEGTAGMESVGGLEELKRWLRGRTEAFTEKARAYGLPQPRGLLLLGVQGCGKSLTAKAVADLWKLPLVRLDLGGLFTANLSPEESVRRAIQVAESMAPVVLWVDEIEKGFAGARAAAGPEGGGSASRVLGSFLIWLQEKTKPVFVVATANEIEGLPPELLRKGRFDEIFFVDLPDVHEREAIFAIHLQKRLRDPRRFDLKTLARGSEHFSGAEIEQVVISALYRAFAEKRELATGDISQAIEETVPLYFTYEERVKELRDWARRRARFASIDSSMLDLFDVETAPQSERT